MNTESQVDFLDTLARDASRLAAQQRDLAARMEESIQGNERLAGLQLRAQALQEQNEKASADFVEQASRSIAELELLRRDLTMSARDLEETLAQATNRLEVRTTEILKNLSDESGRRFAKLETVTRDRLEQLETTTLAANNEVRGAVTAHVESGQREMRMRFEALDTWRTTEERGRAEAIEQIKHTTNLRFRQLRILFYTTLGAAILAVSAAAFLYITR